MKSTAQILRGLCPMHVLIDEEGIIHSVGPTLHKLQTPKLIGANFLEAFDLYRPRGVTNMAQLLANEGRTLYVRLRNPKRTQLKGVLVSDGAGRVVINLSFGISVIDAVRDYALTSRDFAATDLAVEMLYLVEAKSAVLNSSLHLNTRLQGAKTEAERRAATDGLTGLVNRSALDQVLDRLCRSGQSFAVMHMDLDFFKQVNDTYGHAAGDRVLRRVAQVMLEVTRTDDTAARVGGDEFVLIFNGLVNEVRLGAISERLIGRIEQPIMHEGQACHVSASIGICINAEEGADPDVLLERADQALYASKRAGRAQYTFYDPGQEDGNSGEGKALAGE
ncbi:GGDEF domain-containing protein [Pacificoceanicola onchidii]|uniref:GGDEF domain-containing protein n=1 Tax=Pacificoceanicola onchidii TaxID=2562685 RepID=UPI0010A5194A|nr:GGDEF domain-containing protein [Pacificoceanicola onchidii]